MDRQPITAAILAGGQSRRMGRDKAAVPVHGRPMLRHVLDAVAEVGLPAIVVGRERPLWIDVPEPVRFLPDDEPGSGPLGGIATALRRAGTPVLVLAADMPLLTADALRWLLQASRKWDTWDVVAARNGDRVEPLFALYTPAVLPGIEAMLRRGNYKVRDLLATVECRYMDVPDRLRPVLVNVNTEAELRQVQR